MYIALEGVKGVGKSTVLGCLEPMLANELHQQSKRYALLCPTRAMPSQHPLEVQYSQLTCQADLSDHYRETLYAHRSNYHASQVDWQADVILGDRSIITSLAVRWHRVQQGMPAADYFLHVRQQEQLIKLPDVVIQLDCQAELLLARYAQRTRNYGLHEECLEHLTTLKNAYQAVKDWLMSDEAFGITQKRILWHTLDTSHHHQEATAQQILSLYRLLSTTW